MLDLTSRNIDVGQVAEEKLVRGEGAIHLMAESKYYSTLQKVYAAPNLAADISIFGIAFSLLDLTSRNIDVGQVAQHLFLQY